MNTIFINECAADGCYEKSIKGEQLCRGHFQAYKAGQPFKAFYGKTLLKKEFHDTQTKHSIIPYK